MNSDRQLRRRVAAHPASDGDGVKIHRVAGPGVNRDFDPFLLLDEIRSDDSADYSGGFPPHPHRGFETVTYMLHGAMRHEDHLGNSGLLEGGGVQWMTAGSGIVHSEMPEQEDGLLHGFQLWLNLPAAAKMQPAGYRDFAPASIPAVVVPGGELRVVAGQWQGARGPVAPPATRPTVLDIRLGAGSELTLPAPAEEHAAVYVYAGATAELDARELGFYAGGDRVRLQAGPAGVRALFLAGRPLREPIHQYGPFVMNTVEEVERAIDDYRHGRLTA